MRQVCDFGAPLARSSGFGLGPDGKYRTVFDPAKVERVASQTRTLLLRTVFMRRTLQGLLLGAMIGALSAALAIHPTGIDLQEQVDLAWLFALRGPIPPPTNVVIVSIDKRSADRLNLSDQPRDWPRSLHGRLVDRLMRMGASLIVFDVAFTRAQTAEEDAAFAAAIARSRHVLLLESLDRTRQALGNAGIPNALWLEETRRPLPILAAAALGSAPFPLPKYPERVSRFWTFLQNYQRIPTLPALALLSVARDGGNASSLPSPEPSGRRGQLGAVTVGSGQVDGNPSAAGKVGWGYADDAAKRLINGPDSYYLNFYGGPGSIRTIPYASVVDEHEQLEGQEGLRGAYVFVGYSDLATPSNIDTFNTVYARSDGVELGGVEIAATAFANLLTGQTLAHTDLLETITILIVSGALAGALIARMPALFSIIALICLAGCYIFIAQFIFDRHHLWIPLAIPLLIILPLTLVVGLLSQFVLAKRQRSRMQHIVSYYVPERVVQELADHAVDPLSVKQTAFATCLAMDAENFTTLSEDLPPEQTADFLNAFFAALEEPLKRHGADFREFHADSVMCAWLSDEGDTAARARACLAAMEAIEAIQAFNARHAPLQLGVRIGLHAGAVFLGNMGAGGRFAFRVMGDIVNTASRVESLNKQVGTRLLATQEVVAGVDEFLLRPIGTFRLKGKQSATSIFEIRCLRHRVTSGDSDLCRSFARALDAFRAHRHEEAANLFDAILGEHPQDGPSVFYRDYCRSRAASGGVGANDAIIQLNVK